MKRIRIIALIHLLTIIICGCSSQVNQEAGRASNETVSNSSAMEQEDSASSTDSGNSKTEKVEMETTYEVRDGISGFTLKYDDLPSDYQVPSDFSYESMNN